MSPEERAATVVVVIDEVGDPRDPSNYLNDENTVANIAAAIRAAVEEERNACLSVAADADDDCALGDPGAAGDLRQKIIDGISARGSSGAGLGAAEQEQRVRADALEERLRFWVKEVEDGGGPVPRKFNWIKQPLGAS